jgi:hypothetical protein
MSRCKLGLELGTGKLFRLGWTEVVIAPGQINRKGKRLRDNKEKQKLCTTSRILKLYDKFG